MMLKFTNKEVIDMLERIRPIPNISEEERVSVDWNGTSHFIFYNENYDKYYSTLLLNTQSPICGLVFTWLTAIKYDEEPSQFNFDVVEVIMKLTLNRNLTLKEKNEIKKTLREFYKEDYWSDCKFDFIADNEDPDLLSVMAPVHFTFFELWRKSNFK